MRKPFIALVISSMLTVSGSIALAESTSTAGAGDSSDESTYSAEDRAEAREGDKRLGDLYSAEMKRRIRVKWTPPKGTEKLAIKTTFTVLKDGNISRLKVSRSSGNKIADAAALKAVRSAAPFRPLPKEWGPTIEVNFALDNALFLSKQADKKAK